MWSTNICFKDSNKSSAIFHSKYLSLIFSLIKQICAYYLLAINKLTTVTHFPIISPLCAQMF